MTLRETHQNRESRPFFSELPAFVLTFQDKDGGTRIATEKAVCGPAILCYLSLVDALIEVLQFSRIGQHFKVMPAQLVPSEAFRDSDGRGLIADVHLGWPVVDGQILLRPGGALGGCTRMMHHWAREPLSFEFDEIVLAEVTRLHEWAGLFAWRETLDHVRGWEPDRLGRVVAHALTSIELTRGDVTQCRQVALFDPEIEQWHFVPCPDALTSRLSRD
jgi:hypothetical protein